MSKSHTVELSPMQPTASPDPAFEQNTPPQPKPKHKSTNATFITLCVTLLLALAGLIASNVYTMSPTLAAQVTGSVVSGVVLLICIYEIRKRWITVSPNEWLLVIENGQMLRSGVGMRHFCGLNETCVRFPSSIQRINFHASQVTKEMQGLEVSGFAVWSVFREGTGPFNAFKMLQGLSPEGIVGANENLRRMMESIIRHQVANLTIHEVITKRELVRNQTKREMLEVVQGWGVWIETFEICEVKISSHRLFEDLQSEFRAKTHRDAESVRMKLDREIESEKLKSQLETAKERAETTSQRLVYEAQENFKHFQEQNLIESKKLDEQKAIELKRVANDAAIEESKLKAKMSREQVESEHSNAIFIARLTAEQQNLKPQNLQRMMLDATSKIYQNLPLQNMRVVNITSGGGENGGLAQLLPGFASVLEEVKAIGERGE